MSRQKRPLSAIRYIVIHHTASNDAYSTHETLAAHQRATGFGYHATVDDDEAIRNKAAGSDGRATWKQQTPLDEVVWGAAGCNFNALHLAFDGNTSTAPPTDDEVHLAVQILAAWCRKLGWRRSDVGRIVTHNHVGLHISARRYVTECPGRALIALMPSIRSRVAAYLPE